MGTEMRVEEMAIISRSGWPASLRRQHLSQVLKELGLAMKSLEVFQVEGTASAKTPS